MFKIVYKMHLVFTPMHADAVDETFTTPSRICAPVDETFTVLLTVNPIRLSNIILQQW